MREDLRKAPPDPCGRTSFDWEGRLPREAHVSDGMACEAQLDVGEKQKPGPAVGGVG